MELIILIILLISASTGLQFLDSRAVTNGSVHGQVPPTNENAWCRSGWDMNPTMSWCWKYMESLLSWNDSEIQCAAFGGNLVELTSSQELSFAHKLCGQNTDGCWVGGHGFNATVGLYCSNKSCHINTLADSCSMITKKTALLRKERCNRSHASICMLAPEKCYYLHCHRGYLLALIAVSGFILSATLAVVIWLLAHRRHKMKKCKRSRKFSSEASPAPVVPPPPSWKLFSMEELRSITQNFSEANRLPGDTKVGSTYSGFLPDGSNKVAVKKLKRSRYQRKKVFYSEVGRVARLGHPCLVAIKGCCYHHGDRYIVYEFMVNGPLHRWLHQTSRKGRWLSWAMRMKIATTLAQGISFLHDNVKPHVVHRDIRASNVLLDEEFGAHLMGVGLSKFMPLEVMHTRLVAAGGSSHAPYLAPEFIYKNELTTKSDVYSFGVLLLEIVSGRVPVEMVDSVGWQSIFEWATALVQANRYGQLLDPIISSAASDVPETHVVQKLVKLVYACTDNVPSMRPTMSHVVHQLQHLSKLSSPGQL